MSHTPAALELLALLGMSDAGELWAIKERPELTATDRAVSHLALTAALALDRLESGQRLAAAHLDHLGTVVSLEADNAGKGWRGDAGELVHRATKYGEALAMQQAAVDAFRAAAHPLALLAELAPAPAPTTFA